MSSATPGIDVINIATSGEGGNRYAQFRCPGCALSEKWWAIHSLPVRPFVGASDSWEWNGDVVKPVFNPSVLGDKDGPHRCHSWVGCNGAQPGQIVFLGDCNHALKGQVVDLPPWRTAEGKSPWDEE